MLPWTEMKMSKPTKLAHSYVAVRCCYTDMTFQLFVNKGMFPPFVDSQERLHLSGTLANKIKDGSSYSGSLVETCVIQSLQVTHRTLDRCHSFKSGRMSPSSAIANSSKLGCVELASGSGEQVQVTSTIVASSLGGNSFGTICTDRLDSARPREVVLSA
jgi:hypothetical protein